MSDVQTSNVTVTIDDVRAAGLCVQGSRAWFARHGLDFAAFLRTGLSAEALLATGDAMALRVVEQVRDRMRQRQPTKEQG